LLLRPVLVLALLLAGTTLVLAQRPLVRGAPGVVSLSERALSARHVLSPAGRAGGGGTMVVHDESMNHRYFIWQVTWEMIRSRPFVGLGYGNYARRFAEFRDACRDRTRYATLNPVARTQATPHAHNEPLQIWAETGVLGLLATALLLAAGMAGAWRQAGTGGPAAGWACGGLGLLVSLLVDSLVSYPLRLPLGALVFWLGLGIVAGLTQESRASRWAA
ncbi:MAG: O-antigen ligase family protein, partial [Candidatus Latescibacterota bacterium]